MTSDREDSSDVSDDVFLSVGDTSFSSMLRRWWIDVSNSASSLLITLNGNNEH